MPRGAGASGLPTAAGHGTEQSHPTGGRADPCALWQCQAGSAVQSLVHSRRRVRRSGQPGLLPDERCAERAVADRPLRCRRGPSDRRGSWSVPRDASGGVRPSRGGRGRRSGPGRARSGTGFPAQPVRAGRSARSDPGPTGLRAAVCSGPVVGPEDGTWRAARPRSRLRGPQQRSASAHQAPGEPRKRGCSLPSGLVPCLAGRADGLGRCWSQRGGGRTLPARQEVVQD
jgi:hypothetical protein